MNSPILQLLVLAGIAIFLILRLKNVLGTREGFEKSAAKPDPMEQARRNGFEVIEGGADHDIIDHVAEGGESATALAAMKRAEPSFGVGDFLGGARGAYEMILMSFERGELSSIKPFLDEDVYQSFAEVVEERERQGLIIEPEFGGIREMTLEHAEYDESSRMAQITVRFSADLGTVVRDKSGTVIEGKQGVMRRQKDIWTFARAMASDDPNWQLVATGE